MQQNSATFFAKESLGRLVSRAAQAMKGELNRAFAEAGLDVTADQWRVLVHLWQIDGLALNRLSHRLRQEKTGVSRLVSGLVRRGLVTLEADPDDGRVRRVHLTAEGRRLEARCIGLAREVIARSAHGITPEELAVTHRVLGRIHDNLCPETAAGTATAKPEET